MKRILEIRDLKELARRRVPKMFFQYVDAGAWTGITYRDNEADFAKIKLIPRAMVDISDRSFESTMIGETVSMPVAISPTGFAGMMHADGEMLAARAAEKFGIPFTLSTLSICSIEDVASVRTKPFWLQIWLTRDRDFVLDLIDRAKAARCSALVISCDLQVLGQRHNDLRNGLSAPPKLTIGNLINLAMHPRWCMGMLGTKRRTFRNIVGHARGVVDMNTLGAWLQDQWNPRLSWSDIDWIRERWGGKLILKGICNVEDAKLATATGADAIIVSNHGGRQLDGAPSSISVLPSIADAVGDRIEIHFDSGIRSGQDVLKALCLGARGTYIGRPTLFALGALGEEGVTLALQIIRKELDVTMAMCGRRVLSGVNRDLIYSPA